MSDKHTVPPVPAHQEFHWIDGPARHTPYADFLELTLDIAAGIYACQQIA